EECGARRRAAGTAAGAPGRVAPGRPTRGRPRAARAAWRARESAGFAWGLPVGTDGERRGGARPRWVGWVGRSDFSMVGPARALGQRDGATARTGRLSNGGRLA